MKSAPMLSVLLATAATCPAQLDWLVRESGSRKNLTALAFGSGAFVALDSKPLRSTDGVTWTRPTWPAASNVARIFYLGTRFLALSAGSYWLSPDGATAALFDLAPWSFFFNADAAILNGTAIIIGLSLNDPSTGASYNQLARLNADSTAFTPVAPFPSAQGPEWIVATDHEFLVFAAGALFASPDGLSWSLRYRGNVEKPVWKVGVLHTRYQSSSNSGRTWQDTDGPQNPELYAANYFVRRERDRIQISPNNLQWETRESGTTDALNAVAYGNQTFVAVGDFGRVITSGAAAPLPPLVAPDLSAHPSLTLRWPTLLGRWYTVESSPDLLHWTPTAELIPGGGTEISRTYEQTGISKYYRVQVR